VGAICRLAQAVATDFTGGAVYLLGSAIAGKAFAICADLTGGAIHLQAVVAHALALVADFVYFAGHLTAGRRKTFTSGAALAHRALHAQAVCCNALTLPANLAKGRAVDLFAISG